ncbi:hypothetical protein RAT170B_1141 [Rickettsia argasii T170-B]|uniref:Uncharacterized protein n=1 Tax=Rickettsia argasii T170-B TaxID=1268837 RepID=A0A0F3RDI2_9RICK|nr:hypothetical protein RAT170B_1141 [Rickettsia argasii T170-B]
MSIAIEEVITKLTNFVYCFQIKRASGEELNLTNSDHAIKSEERVFFTEFQFRFKRSRI